MCLPRATQRPYGLDRETLPIPRPPCKQVQDVNLGPANQTYSWESLPKRTVPEADPAANPTAFWLHSFLSVLKKLQVVFVRSDKAVACTSRQHSKWPRAIVSAQLSVLPELCCGVQRGPGLSRGGFLEGLGVCECVCVCVCVARMH